MIDSTNPHPNANGKKKAAMASLVIGIILLVLKFIAYFITDSKAIFSDAVESIVNVLGASASIWAIHSAEQPADFSHPYGHGKMEYFSSTFEGGLIGIAAFFLILENIKALIAPTPIGSLDIGLALVILAGLVNLALGAYLIRKGKKEDSPALTGSGYHLLSDFWTSLGVVIGLALVLVTHWNWLDGAIGLIIGLHLAWTSYSIIKESMDHLADRSDEDLLKTLASLFKTHSKPGIIEIHHLKILKSGPFHHIDAHVILPGHWSITQGHDYTKEFETNIFEALNKEGEFAFHIDPCRMKYCEFCRLENCEHRLAEFQQPFPFEYSHLRDKHPPPDEHEN